MKATYRPDGRLDVTFSYDKRAIETIKMIPYYDREWSHPTKTWIVNPTPQNIAILEGIAAGIFRRPIKIPAARSNAGEKFLHPLLIEYIGQPKDRGGKMVSLGLLHDRPLLAKTIEYFLVRFPEDVLKAWFIPGYKGKGDNTPGIETLYSQLGSKPGANENELKKAFRQAAKTWHPDVNKDPAAPAKFREIDEAYKVLRNPQKRKRYDAGLALQETLIVPFQRTTGGRSNWRPPIRCGRITCEGRRMGKFYLVDKIKAWGPILNENNEAMVASWAFGQNAPTINWI